jgi:hypothetical protein
MRPPDADFPNPYASFARRHLGDAIAVVGKVLPDPALALDVASEAIALAYGAVPAGDDAAGDDAAGVEEHEDGAATRAVLDAVENVFRAARANNLVLKRERLRHGEPRPTALNAHARDGITQLCRAPLSHDSPAAHPADVLRRDAPDAAALRQICGSGLVVQRDAAAEEARPPREPRA